MMGGLSYFLGKQLKSLLQYDRDVLTETDLSTIQLCFGGRGSTLFSRWENDREFTRLGVQVAAYAAGDHNHERVKQYFSPDQKHEAAKGMLADAGTQNEQFRFPDAERVVGIGATVTGGDLAGSPRVYESTEYLDGIRGAADGPVVPVVAWDEFRAFINNVSGQCGFGRGNLTPGAGCNRYRRTRCLRQPASREGRDGTSFHRDAKDDLVPALRGNACEGEMATEAARRVSPVSVHAVVQRTRCTWSRFGCVDSFEVAGSAAKWVGL